MAARRLLALALGAALACSGSGATPGPEPPSIPGAVPPRQPAASARPRADPADFTPPGADGFGWAAGLRTLEVVRGGAQPDAPLPLVVVLHGLGDRAHAEWLAGLRVPARLVMPQAPTPYHGGFAWFEYRARDSAPDDLARGIAQAAERVARAIETLRRERPTQGKPIVTGFSQGGMLSYALALAHPELLSAALPVSGLLPAPLWPRERRAGVHYPPIRALHGDADTLVPIEAARSLTEHLRALGFDAELGEHGGVGHTITAEMEVELVANVLAAIAGG